MPGMRCAWPMVSGRTRASFCCTSADRPRTRGVVEGRRDRRGFVALLARDLVALAIEVAGVLHADLDLLGDLRIVHAGAERRQRMSFA